VLVIVDKGAMRGWLVIVAAVIGCASREEDVPPCEKLRDHLVRLRVSQTTVDREAHEKAMRAALGADFVNSCASSLSAAQIKCALAAKDSAAATACQTIR
jgi:hypothetical protein